MDISKLVEISKSRKTEGWVGMESMAMRDMVNMKDTMRDTMTLNDTDQATPKIKSP